ncbi:MAG: hypothetical protein ABI369_03530 [Acetobacteraceae bacterium]
MPNVADIEIIYRIAIRDSGGEHKWAGMDQAERSKAMYSAMRRLDLAGIVTPPISEKELN